MDSEYIKRTVGRCLTQCLAQLNAVRPEDPIEYMACWLHNDWHTDLMTKQAEAAMQRAREEHEASVEKQSKMAAEQSTFTAERAKLRQLVEEQKRQEALLLLTSEGVQEEEEEEEREKEEEEAGGEEEEGEDDEEEESDGDVTMDTEDADTAASHTKLHATPSSDRQ